MEIFRQNVTSPLFIRFIIARYIIFTFRFIQQFVKAVESGSSSSSEEESRSERKRRKKEKERKRKEKKREKRKREKYEKKVNCYNISLVFEILQKYVSYTG